jgi:hypothetical protein
MDIDKIRTMSHPVVLALYSSVADAVAGARAVHAHGIKPDQISVLSRNLQEAGAIARQIDATPGADIEDSRTAAVLGELSGYVFAAMAVVMPGIGPIVAAGPLAAELGEVAGHAAGDLPSVLADAGIGRADGEAIQREMKKGAILLGVHSTEQDVGPVRDALAGNGATWLAIAKWKDA